MKKIIRLTESDLTRIVKRVIIEQGLLSMPDTGYWVDAFGPDMGHKCLQYKSDSQVVLEVFTKVKGLQGQPSQSDKTIQNWVTRIAKSIQGSGITDDFAKVLTEIKTAQQLGAVLNAYNTKFKKPLYQVINGKVSDWKTIRNILKKISGPLKIQGCLKYQNDSKEA